MRLRAWGEERKGGEGSNSLDSDPDFPEQSHGPNHVLFLGCLDEPLTEKAVLPAVPHPSHVHILADAGEESGGRGRAVRV